MTTDFMSADPLIALLHAARLEGSRIPDAEPRLLQLAGSVRRRWNSFAHRHPAPAPDTLSARIEDLARGLLARNAPRAGARPKIDISECRELARRLAGVLSELPLGAG